MRRKHKQQAQRQEGALNADADLQVRPVGARWRVLTGGVGLGR